MKGLTKIPQVRIPTLPFSPLILTSILEYNDAYSNLNKSQLVIESKVFNEKQISEKKCVDLLNKVIFLLN